MQVCLKPNHDEETLSAICFDEQCHNRAAICFYCDQEEHRDHKKKPIKAFLKEYKTQYEQGRSTDVSQLKDNILNFSDKVSAICQSAVKAIQKFQESQHSQSNNLDSIVQNIDSSHNFQGDIQQLLNSILVGNNGFTIKNQQNPQFQLIHEYKKQNQLLLEQIDRNNQQIINQFQVLNDKQSDKNSDKPADKPSEKPKFILQRDDQKVQQAQLQQLLNQNIHSEVVIEITDSDDDIQQAQKKQKQNVQIKKTIAKPNKQIEKQTPKQVVQPIKYKIDQMEEEQILYEPDLYNQQKQPENEEGIDYEFTLSKIVHQKVVGNQMKLICYMDPQRVLMASRDGEIVVYNHVNKEREWNINQNQQVVGLGYFPTTQQIVYGLENGFLHFYQKKQNQYEESKNRQADQHQLIFMHCDNEQIYTYGQDQSLKCISAKTAKELFRLENYLDIPQSMQVLPELNLFVVGGQKSLRFYHFDNQKERQSYASKKVVSIFYHKDGKDSKILVIEENTILKFDKDLVNFQRVELTKYNAKCAGYIQEYEILILGGLHKGKKQDFNDIVSILDRQNILLETIQLQGIVTLLVQHISVQSTLIYLGDKDGNLYVYNLEMQK